MSFTGAWDILILYLTSCEELFMCIFHNLMMEIVLHANLWYCLWDWVAFLFVE